MIPNDGGSQPLGATASVDVAGLSLLIEAERAADLDLVERLVGTRPATRDAEASLRIGTTIPPLPSRAPDFEGPYGDHWDDGSRHEFWHHWGLGAVIDPDRAVLGGPVSGHRRWVAVRNSMLFILAKLFLERGRFVLHGAAIRRDHTTLLVVGDSGTGKSTLAFAARAAGWRVLGDDMVVVEPGDTPSVRGIPRVPSIPGDVAHHATGGEPLPDDARERVELVGFELDADPAPITGVALCDHGDGAGAVEPLSPVSAVEALVPAFVLSALTGPVRQWFPTAMALGRGPCVRLRQPADADARVAEAARLLDLAAAPPLAPHDP